MTIFGLVKKLLLSIIVMELGLHCCQADSGLYVGASAGPSYLWGRRSDLIENPSASSVLVATERKKVSMTTIEGHIFCGYQFKPAKSKFNFDIEPYFLYGPQQDIIHKNFIIDPDDALYNHNHHTATLKRSWAIGVVGKIGYQMMSLWKLYILGGIQQDRFTYSMTDSMSDTKRRKRTLPALVGGIGIETKISFLKVGMEFRYISYQNLRRQRIDQGNDLNKIYAKLKSGWVGLRVSYAF